MKILFRTFTKFNPGEINSYSYLISNIPRNTRPYFISSRIAEKFENEKLSWWYIHSFWLETRESLLKNENIN